MFKARLVGIQKATTFLGDLAGKSAQFNKVRVYVGSNLVYAYGIEFGKHRNGSLARRAGGAFMLTNALRSSMPEIRDALAHAFNTVQAFGMALWKIGLRIQNQAMGQTPVRTGSLRRSMHTIREGF